MSKKQQRLDKIMAACREKMQEEISALLGKAMTFALPETKVLTKAEFFSESAAKSVCAHVNLDGDLEGQGCLIVPVKDAIRIGGTLIMLPESELDSVIEEEEYTEELEDSYGEIANIICGSLTSTFEEQYPKSFRLVRTEQEVILPGNVDIDSDQPVAAGPYYLMSSAMALEDAEMGNLQLLLPAASFGLVAEETVPEKEEESGQSSDDVSSVTDSSTIDPPEGDQQEIIERQSAASEERAEPLEPEERDSQHVTPAAATKSTPQDLEKRKKQIEQLLNNCLAKTGEEVGALLGGTLKIEPETEGVFTKEELLDQAGAKQVMARLDIRGQGEGEGYLLVSLKDAIYLGGTLIMLPDTELEEVIRNDEFGEDAEDAYGEVANIIAGVYTGIFEEQYQKKFGFVKTGLEVVIPAKVDPDSDDVLPNKIYYLHSGELTFNDKQLGRLQAVFPANLFELETFNQQKDVEEEATEEPSAERQQTIDSGEESGADSSRSQEVRGQDAAGESVGGGDSESQSASEGANVLLFTDDDVEAQSIAGILTENGYSPRVLHYRDPVGGHLTPSISLVFLVMKEVNEQGFGMAIKLISGGVQVPIVAASPAWTKTTVLKAVKYGAVDILITPASSEDVQEKLDANLVRKAA